VFSSSSSMRASVSSSSSKEQDVATTCFVTRRVSVYVHTSSSSYIGVCTWFENIAGYLARQLL
jgi:hypothetical protein